MFQTRAPGGGRKPNTFENIEKVLKKKTYIDPVSDCWIWEGAKNIKGYGHVKIQYIDYSVNRISGFLYLNLDITNEDVHVLHKCPNKACWNPAHLYLGDNFTNWRDRKEGSEVTNLTRRGDE